jgi:hypothetical protein
MGPEMRFSPMKIIEGKCASKYCEIISAEKLPDLSDANFTITFSGGATWPARTGGTRKVPAQTSRAA